MIRNTWILRSKNTERSVYQSFIPQRSTARAPRSGDSWTSQGGFFGSQNDCKQCLCWGSQQKLNLNLEVAFNLLSLQIYSTTKTPLCEVQIPPVDENYPAAFTGAEVQKKTSICSQRRDLDNLKARKQCNWEIKIFRGWRNLWYIVGIFIVSTGAWFFSVSWTKATSGWPHRQSSVEPGTRMKLLPNGTSMNLTSKTRSKMQELNQEIKKTLGY